MMSAICYKCEEHHTDLTLCGSCSQKEQDELAALRAEVEKLRADKAWQEERALNNAMAHQAEVERLKKAGGKLAHIVLQELNVMDVDNLTTQARYRRYESAITEFNELRKRTGV